MQTTENLIQTTMRVIPVDMLTLNNAAAMMSQLMRMTVAVMTMTNSVIVTNLISLRNQQISLT